MFARSAMAACGLGTSEFNDEPEGGGDGTAKQSTPKMPRQRYSPWRTGPVEIRRQDMPRECGR